MRIGLYKGKSITSKVIKTVTNSKYSHVSIILPDNTVVDAWKRVGVRHNQESNLIESLSVGHKKGTPIDIFEIDIENSMENAAFTFYLGQLGSEYDTIGALLSVTSISRPSDDKWFCSELFNEGLAIIDYNIPRESHKVTPGNIVKELKNLKYINTVYSC